jgi:hypothetical protein
VIALRKNGKSVYLSVNLKNFQIDHRNFYSLNQKLPSIKIWLFHPREASAKMISLGQFALFDYYPAGIGTG